MTISSARHHACQLIWQGGSHGPPGRTVFAISVIGDIAPWHETVCSSPALFQQAYRCNGTGVLATGPISEMAVATQGAGKRRIYVQPRVSLIHRCNIDVDREHWPLRGAAGYIAAREAGDSRGLAQIHGAESSAEERMLQGRVSQH